jgi:hypothetical protein
MPAMVAQFIDRGNGNESVRFHVLSKQSSLQMLGTFTKEFNDNWLEEKRKEGFKVVPFNKYKMRYYYQPMYQVKDPK